MSDIKRNAEKAQHKVIEKKGEIKGRIKQMQQDAKERSANEE
ncbi:MAG TPA: hypothetical protein VLF43_03400 [Candidatus Saccharimonadales bacterium]|nr:hypothetical protein [Candidatus Saccharimonadales bacterium]